MKLAFSRIVPEIHMGEPTYPIIPNVTVEYLNLRIDSARTWIEKYHKFISENPTNNRVQWAYSNLATNYFVLGSCEFAFGDFANCKTFLARAAVAWIEVFKLRGTYCIQFEAEGRKDHKIDYSLSNSRELRTAIYCALIAEKFDIGFELARLDQTDEKSHFVSDTSSICSIEDIKFASIIRRILSGVEVAPTDFEQLKTRTREMDLEKQILECLVAADGKAFENYVLQFLEWHESFRLADNSACDPIHFACFPVAAICQLAKHRCLTIDSILHSKYATANLIR